MQYFARNWVNRFTFLAVAVQHEEIFVDMNKNCNVERIILHVNYVKTKVKQFVSLMWLKALQHLMHLCKLLHLHDVQTGQNELSFDLAL